MKEEHTTTTETYAKIIIFSVTSTVLILIGLLYIGRGFIISYIGTTLQPTFSTMVPEVPEYTSREELIIAAIERVNPTVVSVIVTKDVPVYEQYYETVDPWGLFGGITIPRIRENGTTEQEVGGGTGFIVSQNGLIVTNRHVVSDEEASYSIVMSDGALYQAEVVAKDEQLDIALIRIAEPIDRQLPVARFATDDDLKLGQTVIAIGNALAEFQNSVSVGVVSGLSRSITASDYLGQTEQLNQVIQTDAAINPGNSGGPLINTAGEVVGVNVATSRGADNIGFALPASFVEQIVRSVQATGAIERPFLGVRYVMLNPTLAKERAVPVSYGALIISGPAADLPGIAPASPADVVGLQTGDVIRAIDGVSLQNRDLATLLRSKQVGETITVTVWRAGEEYTYEITLDQAL